MTLVVRLGAEEKFGGRQARQIAGVAVGPGPTPAGSLRRRLLGRQVRIAET